MVIAAIIIFIPAIIGMIYTGLLIFELLYYCITDKETKLTEWLYHKKIT